MLDKLKNIFGEGETEEEIESEGRLEEVYFESYTIEDIINQTNLLQNMTASLALISYFVIVVAANVFGISLGWPGLLFIFGALVVGNLIKMYAKYRAFDEIQEILEGVHDVTTITPTKVYEENLEVYHLVEIVEPDKILRQMQLTADAFKMLAANAQLMVVPGNIFEEARASSVKPLTQKAVLDNLATLAEKTKAMFRKPAFDLDVYEEVENGDAKEKRKKGK